MLGTIHRDPEGPGSLARWLQRIDPDVITLEFSNYGLRFRQINGEQLRKRLCEAISHMGMEAEGPHGSLDDLFSYINLPYEFTTVSDYARKTGSPFHLVDADLFSYLKLRGIDRIVARENVEALLQGQDSPRFGTSCEKALAELFFRRGIRAYRYTGEMHIRDNFMKDRISLLMQHHGPGRYLHICGWQHLSDPHGTYTPLKPIRVFIYDRAFRI